MDMKTFKALIYTGSKWEDKKLTLERVGELIAFDNIKDAENCILDIK